MDSAKRNNESEMGSGDSDDEFYKVKLPYTPEVASDKPLKKVQVKKVYSPPRTKVQYNYKFDSSSDDEYDGKSHQKIPKTKHHDSSENSKRHSEKKEKGSLSQSTCKVVEKINEELRSLKNSGSKSQGEKTEALGGQNHVATSMSSVARPSISVVPPVVVVPPPMVVQQASVMGPVIVPSAIGMGGPMAMMSSQNMMGIRGPSTVGLASSALSSSMMGMNAVPGMMGMQGNLMGMPGGVITPAAMSGLNVGMAGSMMRIPGAGNAMFRMQGAGGNMLGITRPSSSLPTAVGVPRTMATTAGSLMVNNPMLSNPGGLMVMGGMMSNPVAGGAQASGGSLGSSNIVRMVSSPQGSLPIRVPPPPPFLSFRGRAPVPPGSFRWHTNAKVQVKVESPTTSGASSPGSSPLDKSSRDYDGDEYSGDEKKSPLGDTDESQSPPRELPNTFKNDGSFMEMFKKMTKESESSQEAASSQEKASGNFEGSESSSSASALKRPQVMLSGIVGKRRGGRVLKTGLVKKVKKGGDGEEEKHPKDAWSMYMAEVKKYREASCEEEGKTRPLVK